MPAAPNPGRLLELSGMYWQTCTRHAAVKLDLNAPNDSALLVGTAGSLPSERMPW